MTNPFETIIAPKPVAHGRMEECEGNAMRQIIKGFALLALAICRQVYCWTFLIGSYFGFRYVYRSIRGLMQSPLVDTGHIVSITSNAIYSVVWVIAWWMILRKKPAAKRWAIAANLILIFTYLPVLMFGNWRGFLKLELDWWQFILIGIFGIIIFSVPYHGWRLREPLKGAQAEH
ncbi:MAG TPA: hypothetical protein VND90_13835 [Terracidiphilus sp.]|nr:hypothetical protein [Terracidiphilus sp.]